MSLINKMLQDLESRKEPQAEAASKKPVYEDLKPLNRPPPARARSRLPLILLATVVVAGAAAYAWTRWGDSLVGGFSPDEVAVKSAPVATRKPVAPKPVPAPAQAPAGVASVAQAEVLTPPVSPAPVEKPAQAPVAPPVAEETEKPGTLSAPKPVVMPANSKATSATENGFWKVSRGETLYNISIRTGVDLLSLSRWNKLGRDHVIYPGQRLRLTPPQEKTAAAPDKTTEPRISGPKPAPATPASAGTGHGGEAVMDKRVKPFSPLEKAESEYRRAADLLQKGRAADAEKHLKNALNAATGHTPSRELLAGLMLQQGHWREAQKLLEQGLDAVPAHLPFAQLLARVHVEHGADNKALAVMEENRRAAAGNPEYLAFLAALYQRVGKHAEAVKSYNEAVKLNPQEGRWWLGMGISLEAAQDWNAAGEAYQRAIDGGMLDDKLLKYARQRLAIVNK